MPDSTDEEEVVMEEEGEETGQDEDSVEEEEFHPVEKEYDVTVIASVDDVEFQIDVDYNSDLHTVTNLSQQLQIDKSTYYAREIQGHWVSYYSWNGDEETKTRQKNVGTGETFQMDNFCLLPSPPGNILQHINFVSGNEEWLFFVYSLYDTENNSEQYFLKIFDKISSQCQEVRIEPNAYAANLADGIRFHQSTNHVLALLYNSSSEDPVEALTLIDLEAAQLINSFIFDDDYFFFGTFKESDFLYLSGPVSYTSTSSYKLYNPTTLQETEGGSTSNIGRTLHGLFSYDHHEEKMAFETFFLEQGPYRGQPAIFDFEQNKIIEGEAPYLETLSETLIAHLSTQAVFPAFRIDLANRNIILGYDRNDSSGKGGLIYTNFDLEIYKIVELDYVPEEIIIRNIN